MADQNLSPNLNALPLPPRYPGIARALAHLAARRAVKEQLRAKRCQLTTFPYAEICERARTYLAEHQEELLAQAMKAVERDPTLRKMAEREERDRERQWRKSARMGAVEKHSNRSV